jgi:hypothetical protein
MLTEPRVEATILKGHQMEENGRSELGKPEDITQGSGKLPLKPIPW